MCIGPDNADKLVADVKQEIQLQQKSKSLLYVCKIYATHVLSTMCAGENLVTEATDVKHEANNEQKCKSPLFHRIKQYCTFVQVKIQRL